MSADKLKCDFCPQDGAMSLHNLQNNVKKTLCPNHWGELCTQGQSVLYQQAIDRMHGPIMTQEEFNSL